MTRLAHPLLLQVPLRVLLDPPVEAQQVTEAALVRSVGEAIVRTPTVVVQASVIVLSHKRSRVGQSHGPEKWRRP